MSPGLGAIQAGHEPEVLDPGIDEADVCRHPDEQSNRKNEECKHVEGVAELGRLGARANATTAADTTVRKMLSD
jgi:hypothetical protein